MGTLHILSGGAAQGLVRALADDFESQHDLHLSGTFGAVGAMKAMGLSKDPQAIGCTQVTEILSTPGVQLVGDLPKAHELATVYTAVLAKRARQVEMAQALIAHMASPSLSDLRAELGFLPA